jgi:NADPH:quinone reductase
MPDPTPGPGEVRIRVHASGVNPGDVKKREGWLGSTMPYARVIPHSDGAGEIDAVGAGVESSRVGERVWCYGAQSYRQFGTAAEHVIVPQAQAVRLPERVPYDVGACLGIPGITAHRAIFADGPVRGRTVMVAGAAGAVGSLAVQLAAWAGAIVLATVRSKGDVARARASGAEHVFVLGEGHMVSSIRAVAQNGVDRIVEVALGANGALDAEILAQGGVIAAYASSEPEPRLPFWPLLFQNAVVRLLGSDDFPAKDKERAAQDLTRCLEADKLKIEIGARFALDDIAAAHRALPSTAGRVIVDLSATPPSHRDGRAPPASDRPA